jgi:isopentenyl-diphosphate delta-isomerase
MAQPFLAPALESTAAVVKKINEIKDELRIVQFCTGSGDIASLRSAPWQC